MTVLLAQISDLHLDGSERATRRAERVMDHLRALPRPVDAVLVTGDIADHGAEAEYEEAARILAAPFPVLPCPGNHDARPAYRTALLQALTIPTDEPEPDAQTYERAPRPRPVEPDAPQHDPNTAPPAKTPEKRARDNMFALLGDVGLKERNAALALMSRVTGRLLITSSTELSDDEVQLMIQTLRDWKQTGIDPTTGEVS